MCFLRVIPCLEYKELGVQGGRFSSYPKAQSN